MELSIIVINYNNSAGLERTLGSIELQENCSSNRFNVLVVDGASKDNSLEIVEHYKDSFEMKIISEPDKGIYDAMNKGLDNVEESSATHFVFLNSGDIFSSEKSLATIFTHASSCSSVTFFRVKNVYKNSYNYRPHSKKSRVFNLGIPNGFFPCHQSVVCPVGLLGKLRFDDELKISADTKFLNELFSDNRTRYVSECVVNFELGGVSSYYNNFHHYLTHAREKNLINPKSTFLARRKVYLYGFLKYLVGKLLGKDCYFLIYLGVKK